MSAQPAKFVARYQSFAEVGGPAHGAARAAALRAELAARGLAGFVVPRADEHQNEYVPPGAERLLWLTGFSGSAGLAIVLADMAALFVDGRYTLQAPAQVDGSVLTVKHVVQEPPSAWIEANLGAGAALGYDPWLHTPESVERLAKACRAAGGELVAVETNPIDVIWPDRPGPPLAPIHAHPERLAGERASAKLKRVGEALKGADGLLVSDAHSVAWLFNIRGGDVAHTPLPLAFAYAPREGRPTLFVDALKLTGAIGVRLGRVAEIAPPEALVPFVAARGAAGARIVFDAATAPARLTQALEAAGGKAIVKADPIARMKAVKNAVELAGTRAAHIRDGAALSRFLAWFDAEAPGGHLTEIDAAAALETFRRDTGALKDVSFPTIAAAGPHAAIAHYRVSDASNLKIGRGLFLDRQRRPVRGRHHRHHAHDQRRPADRRAARPLHPGAQGPHRHRARDLSARDDRRPARHVGARSPVARRARFRSRNGPRRRRLSLGSRRAAAAVEDRFRPCSNPA